MRINESSYGQGSMSPLISAADTNPHLAAALDATNYRTAATSLTSLKTAAQAWPDAARTWDDLATELIAKLDAGETFDLPSEAAKLAQEQATMQVVKSVAEQAAGSLRARRDSAIAGHAADAEAYLDAELKALVTKARGVRTKLDGIADADAAIAAGKTKEWKAWSDCVQAHTDLREAQRQLIMRVDGRDEARLTWGNGAGDESAAICIIENAADIEPRLGNVLRFGAIHKDNRETSEILERLYAPWPQELFNRAVWLEWLCDNEDAQPWVPNRAQRDAQRDALLRLKADATRDGKNGAGAAFTTEYLGQGYDPRQEAPRDIRPGGVHEEGPRTHSVRDLSKTPRVPRTNPRVVNLRNPLM